MTSLIRSSWSLQDEPDPSSPQTLQRKAAQLSPSAPPALPPTYFATYHILALPHTSTYFVHTLYILCTYFHILALPHTLCSTCTYLITHWSHSLTRSEYQTSNTNVLPQCISSSILVSSIPITLCTCFCAYFPKLVQCRAGVKAPLYQFDLWMRNKFPKKQGRVLHCPTLHNSVTIAANWTTWLKIAQFHMQWTRCHVFVILLLYTECTVYQRTAVYWILSYVNRGATANWALGVSCDVLNSTETTLTAQHWLNWLCTDQITVLLISTLHWVPCAVQHCMYSQHCTALDPKMC